MDIRMEDIRAALGDRTKGLSYLAIVQTAALLEHAERKLAEQVQNNLRLEVEIQELDKKLDNQWLVMIDHSAPVELNGTALEISIQCDEVRKVLFEKNRQYGDSAIKPVRVFSKCDSIEQLNVRMDDKLSRIMSAQDDDAEDAELDLIGYLILKRVAKRLQA